jgi:hypothetical protein
MIDFLSSFPGDRMVERGHASAARSTRVLRMVRLLRLFKIARVIKMSKFFEEYVPSRFRFGSSSPRGLVVTHRFRGTRVFCDAAVDIPHARVQRCCLCASFITVASSPRVLNVLTG